MKRLGTCSPQKSGVHDVHTPGVAKNHLGQNSVIMDRLGGFVTAPMKSTTLGCRNRLIIAT
jgi:hypothetical protein